MDIMTVFLLIIFFLGALTAWKGIKIVPQQEAWIIERMGKYDRKLEPGLEILLPYIERVAYKHSLKERAVDVAEQHAITKDNVTVLLDGVIYIKIIDPVAASYGVHDPIYACIQLAQTTMRSEIGKMSLDKTFEERDQLNVNIVEAINHAAENWGIQCMRYEIRNITPPKTILNAMEMQVEADRSKRAAILQSEGEKQSAINKAEGEKQRVVLSSEASMIDQVNRAKGEAQAILAVAEATAEGLQKIAKAILAQGGSDAVSLRVAEQYIKAFSKLAKESTTVLMPTNVGDAGSMVAQAMTVFEAIKKDS